MPVYVKDMKAAELAWLLDVPECVTDTFLAEAAQHEPYAEFRMVDGERPGAVILFGFGAQLVLEKRTGYVTVSCVSSGRLQGMWMPRSAVADADAALMFLAQIRQTEVVEDEDFPYLLRQKMSAVYQQIYDARARQAPPPTLREALVPLDRWINRPRGNRPSYYNYLAKGR